MRECGLFSPKCDVLIIFPPFKTFLKVWLRHWPCFCGWIPTQSTWAAKIRLNDFAVLGHNADWVGAEWWKRKKYRWVTMIQIDHMKL